MVEYISQFLATLSPFSELDEEVRHDLARTAQVRSYDAKEFIFFEGDKQDLAFAVISGRVAMLKSSPNGKELIVELVPSNEVFGVVSLLCQGPYPLSARAQVNSEILILEARNVLPICAKYPRLQQGLVQVVTNRMRATQDLARALAHDRVEARVASILLTLLPRNRSESIIEISRTEIADLTGITIETASRVTKALERDGVVDLSQQGAVRVLLPSSLEDLINKSASASN